MRMATSFPGARAGLLWRVGHEVPRYSVSSRQRVSIVACLAQAIMVKWSAA
jgi:hypothetical protein